MTALQQIADIEAQLDSTVPYYLPQLLKDYKAALIALTGMVSIYDGVRDVLTCPNVIGKLAAADHVIAQAKGRR